MRRSTYEIILPLVGEDDREIEGKALLVNGLYSSFDIVAKDDAEKIVAGDFAALSPALCEGLLLRGHLTQKSEAEEIDDMKLLGHVYRTLHARSNVSLTIMPTYGCNFRCPYCYEQHRIAKGQTWLEHTMDLGTIDAVFDALEDCWGRGYALGDCTLYGGEPLLAKNVATVRKIAEHCQKLGMKLNAVTNGYDLDGYLGLLEEYGCQWLQVSVDGVGEVNDRRRIHKDGLPTYDRILRNIELALRRGIHVYLRINVGRENISGMGALVADLRGRGFIGAKNRSGQITCYFRATTDDCRPEKNVSEQAVMEELLNIGFTAGETIEHHMLCDTVAEYLRKLFCKEELPDYSPAFCGAEQGMFVVDPFGRIFPCWNIVARDDADVGYVDKEQGKFMLNFDKAKWRTRTADLMPTCRTCPYVFICRGGCAGHALHEHGSCFREHCGEIKEIFAFVAPRIAGKEWAKNNVTELSLSLAGLLSHLTSAERKTLSHSKNWQEVLSVAKTAGLL